MGEERNDRDFYWKLNESKKQEIIDFLKKSEKEVDFDPKNLIEKMFPALSDEEVYKIWSMNRILNKYFENEKDNLSEEKIISIKN